MNMQKIEQPLKINDILVSSWGYDQTNVDFYQVVKVSKCFAELMPIVGGYVECSDRGTDKVVPILSERLHYSQYDNPEPILRRKISSSHGEIYIRISSCQYARPWNGQPQRQTNSAFGH